MTRKNIEISVLVSVATLIAVFFATEHVYFFPLTPLSLDMGGRTQLVCRPGRARLLYVGDIKLADSAAATIRNRGYAHLFAATVGLLRNADLTVGNLEGPITAKGRKKTNKRWSYKVPPAAATALARAGFDLMNLANNHIQDCGDIGIRESMEHLRKAGVEPFGGGMNAVQAHRPVVRVVRGLRVANLGYIPPWMRLRGKKTSLRGLAWTRSRGGGAWGSRRRVKRDIQRARNVFGADIVVVSFHMGDRYQRTPEPFERDVCHAAIDAGADVVIGHGTHIMGPIEVYRKRPIFYSVGNFAFGSWNVRARFGLIAVIEADLQSRRIEGAYAIPIYTVNANPWVGHQTKVLRGRQGRKVLERLKQRSRTAGGRIRIKKSPLRAEVVF